MVQQGTKETSNIQKPLKLGAVVAVPEALVIKERLSW